MNVGRNICKELKEIRRHIAEENGIPLKTEECTYKGACRGTCPHCEAEVRYLQNALADRIRLGKVATVAGLALGLATTAHSQNVPPQTVQNTVQASQYEVSLMADSVRLIGIIRDNNSNEEIPFCTIRLWDDKRQVFVFTKELVENGIRGSFSIRVPKGEYTLVVSHYGYKDYRQDVEFNGDTSLGDIMMEPEIVQTSTLGGVEDIPRTLTPRGQAEYYQGIGGTTIVVR